MTARFKIFGSVLMLLLATSSNGDPVTTRHCRAIAKYGWERIRDDIDTEATSLQMDSCNLTTVTEVSDFQNLPNLGTVDLSNNFITHVDTTVFTNAPSTLYIFLKNNKLQHVPVFVDKSCPNATEIDLESNGIIGITDEETFKPCTNLEKIYLSYNKIVDIHHSIFDSLTNLITLDLSHNKIEHLPEKIFAKNANLRFVTLDHNKITRILPNFVRNLKSTSQGLSVFEIDANPWHCSCLLNVLADMKRFELEWYNQFAYGFGSEIYKTPSCVFNRTVSCSKRISS